MFILIRALELAAPDGGCPRARNLKPSDHMRIRFARFLPLDQSIYRYFVGAGVFSDQTEVLRDGRENDAREKAGDR